jgi:menaquinone-dependent protoporphyrinogen oxidase
VSALRVLVAFASRSGSTAGIAEAIAGVLRDAGLEVDSSPAGDIADVTPYDAVVLGSGVFLPHRGSDGGGFLVRHGAILKTRAVWLFCAGPIGRGRAANDAEPAASGDCSVAEVARSVGARGCAEFGTPVPEAGADPVAELAPVDVARVRAWAREIAEALQDDPGVASRGRTAEARRSGRPQPRVRATATS